MVLRTLYGEDRCSPAGDRSSSGAACTSDCALVGQVYQCYTDQARTKTEDCGLWTSDDIKTVEYTVDDKVGMQSYKTVMIFVILSGLCRSLPGYER